MGDGVLLMGRAVDGVGGGRIFTRTNIGSQKLDGCSSFCRTTPVCSDEIPDTATSGNKIDREGYLVGPYLLFYPPTFQRDPFASADTYHEHLLINCLLTQLYVP